MRWFALVMVGVLLSAFCAAVETKTIRGQVVTDGQPVAEALVRFQATPFTTRSNSDGRFELRGNGERVTAWKEGYFIAGQTVGNEPITISLRPLPKEDHADYTWIDPRPEKGQARSCGVCHAEIFKEWAGSAHGRGLQNKQFINLYDGSDVHGNRDKGWNLLKDHPDGAGVCAACHAPSVPFGHPGQDDFRKLDGVHALGVHCDYCHKIADASAAKLGLEHGRFAHRLLRPSKGLLKIGPLDDVFRGEDSYSPLYKKSEYCASCHEGTVFGTKVYTTYNEWLASPARAKGQQCQGCHMTPTGTMTNIAPGKGGVERDPLTLASHTMPGGTKEMLQRCLKVNASVKRTNKGLELNVETLASDVGHRVPTGFIDRQLILVVEAFDKEGKRLVTKDGPVLPAACGDLAQLPGRFYARQIEDDQGLRPVPFWRPNREFTDTRLFPEKPDQQKWVFTDAEAARIRVRLVYRRFFHEVAVSKGWKDNDLVVYEREIQP